MRDTYIEVRQREDDRRGEVARHVHGTSGVQEERDERRVEIVLARLPPRAARTDGYRYMGENIRRFCSTEITNVIIMPFQTMLTTEHTYITLGYNN